VSKTLLPIHPCNILKKKPLQVLPCFWFGTAIALVLAGLFLSVPVQAQDLAAPPLSREQMWPAPTGEDWKKPCLIQF